MLKKVSIIIPVYNATKSQLNTSIDSVINQTYGNIELIIINDKSTKEETIDQLNKCNNLEKLTAENGHSRSIKLCNCQHNIGISSSRNRGIDESSGEYVCFLDQDDCYDTEYVAKLVEALESEDADIAMCGFCSLDEKCNITSKFPLDDMDTKSPWYPWSTCAIWNRLYRREFLVQNNIRFPDGCVTEDIVFLMQCNLFSKKIAVVQGLLYRNIIGQTSTSRSKEFHSLKLDQMPFDQINNLIKVVMNDNSLRNSKYLQALICNEMALLCYVLSVGSDHATVKEAANKAGDVIRLIANKESLNNIRQFNKYCKDKKSMQILIKLMYCSSRLHLETQIAMLVSLINKTLRI